MVPGHGSITERLPVADRSVARPSAFLIGTDSDSCRECWGCVRYCPAKAIRVIDGRSEIIEERCVKCGLCVSECGSCGHTVRDDTAAVRELLASGRPVVAVLATEFIAALHPRTPSEVEYALETRGFHAVESTLLGEEMVASAYERMHAMPCASLMLRSTCPVVVDWVRKFYPSLTSALSPIVPPYIAQARLVRQLYGDDIAIVYVSPCFARKDEPFEPDLTGAVDVTIDFTELERLIADIKPRPPYAMTAPSGQRRPSLLKEISLTDGFPRRTLVERDSTDTDVVTVRGLRQLDEFLSAVSRGEAAPAVVDMLNCEGCIDGPAVRPGMSVFAKRNVVAAERDAHPHSWVSTRDLLRYLPEVDTMRTFKATPVVTVRPSDEQIDATLAEGCFHAREEALDCGACGYATCVEHAVAIIAGNSSWDMCFPLQRQRMEQTNRTLEESATTDSLTGLGNRRVFDDRLAEEIARTTRYGSPLSLLMLDVDCFKDINDEHGHPTGDTVLCELGEILRDNIRETDIATRYGGDEFAIILPGVGKTEAFAAAEKMRLIVARRRFALVRQGNDDSMNVTVSVGVATAVSETADALGLLEAADRALYHAKQSGRDQVRLSAG